MRESYVDCLNHKLLSLLKEEREKSDHQTLKSDEELAEKAKEIEQSIRYNIVDFRSYKELSICQDGKRRYVREYGRESNEYIITKYIKRYLDKKYNISYPNRNSIMRNLFNEIKIIRKIKGFLIVKMDFQDYYNSISSSYVYENFIKGGELQRIHMDLLDKFVEEVPFCYAGIPVSNALAELIGREFDEVLVSKLHKDGLIYYKRYIDDIFMIFNNEYLINKCIDVVNDVIREVYKRIDVLCGFKCSTRINANKTCYIQSCDLSGNNEKKIDFLGYQFSISKCIGNKNNPFFKIKYGITEKKRTKYKNQIKKIVEEYKRKSNKILLKHRIRAFCSRVVYVDARGRSEKWINRGILANYRELRCHVKELDAETNEFLDGVVSKVFDEMNVPKPRFIINPFPSPYRLKDAFKKNQALMLTPYPCMGYSLESLKTMCKSVGGEGETDSYHELLREYLDLLECK